ncbi:MAG: hypothetical protein K2Y39_22160 [Candidatus Obscuribacterales bacterium]|nr:hypothetical protein [Candidatus Obscuribacterales bacterium]
MTLHTYSDVASLHESTPSAHPQGSGLGDVSLAEIRALNRDAASNLPDAFGNTFGLHSGDNTAPIIMASKAKDDEGSMKSPSEVSVTVPEGMHGEVSGKGCAVKVEPSGPNGKDSKITVTPINGSAGCSIHQYPVGL